MERLVKLTVDARLSINIYAAIKLNFVSRALLTVCCLLAMGGRPAAGLSKERSLNQFTYQTWQTGSGLPQNTIHSVLQGRDGYLWLATEGGLVRFDGYNFVVFDTRNAPDLGSDDVESLLEDQAGALWIGTAAGLCRRTESGIEKVRTAGLEDVKNILALHADQTGGVWVVLPEELLSIRERQTGLSVERYPLGQSSSRFTGAIASGTNGVIWAGTQTGLKRLVQGQLNDVRGALPPASVNALLADRSSRVWIGTAKGLYASDQSGATIGSVNIPHESGAILSLFEDWEGSIWLGSENGLIRLEADVSGTHAQVSERVFPGVSVITLAEDSEKDLWIGTESQGLSIVRNPKFVTFTARDGLANDAVRCVFEGSEGSIWVGTNTGLTQLKNGRFTQWTTQNGLSSNVILSLNEDSEGRLLIGTPDGLDRLKDKTVSVETSSDGLADDFVRSLYRDADGSLWVGTRRGLSHEQSGHKFTTYTQGNGLGNELVGAILRDRRNNLWVGTLGGLSELQGGKFHNYTTRDGLSSNTITALFEDGSGDLWIGTQDGGLNLRSHGKIVSIAKKFGLPQVIYGIAEDSEGELWFSSNAGIARANETELKKAAAQKTDHATVIWYGTSDGLQINECSGGGHPGVWKARDGTLWFSTLKGVAALYPEAAHLNHVLPPVAIESVTIGSKSYAPGSVHKIEPGHARLAFDYAGISFAAPQKVIYRYQLEGFDKDWVEARAARTAYYTNLAPGAYRFRVIARNNDGFWDTAGASTQFEMEPHFYQTIWFYLLAALATGFAAYLIYRWRVAEVRSRFDAVLQERNRIAREIHDTLAQGFVGVSVQLEIVSRLLTATGEAAREPLNQARLLVRESISEARRSIWQLRSQTSGNEDLASRLSSAATLAIGSHPVKFTLEVHGTYRPLNATAEDELLRIGQEAVNNALRHAEPKEIQITLTFGRKLRMVIADDGKGFTPGDFTAGPAGHFGLKGMRERAKQIKAALKLDSVEGKGTRVIVEAPLN